MSIAFVTDKHWDFPDGVIIQRNHYNKYIVESDKEHWKGVDLRQGSSLDHFTLYFVRPLIRDIVSKMMVQINYAILTYAISLDCKNLYQDMLFLFAFPKSSLLSEYYFNLWYQDEGKKHYPRLQLTRGKVESWNRAVLLNKLINAKKLQIDTLLWSTERLAMKMMVVSKASFVLFSV